MALTQSLDLEPAPMLGSISVACRPSWKRRCVSCKRRLAREISEYATRGLNKHLDASSVGFVCSGLRLCRSGSRIPDSWLILPPQEP